MSATLLERTVSIPNTGENKLVNSTTVPCLYCYNLDHWIPTSDIVREVECKRCDKCPMYVPLWEWEDHVGHASGNAAVITCPECPVCEGLIKPTEKPVECLLCPECQSYVPAHLWDQHAQANCGRDDDPFS